ncbi:hypothetical protein G6M87_32360 (plasmid) [Rhizobium rhizogenes]|uniref:hypothetical protein n=1 Tax=Rhizobium rhizogenes TaxID=359 RepID=UPI0015720315|nr:hypothetical protein [Rhizobium rhizogenes]NTI26909.1 hypothetical protein [Rhizobium rhizogenes]QTG10239.1 hypothetical protein G6M87_32360 [Rhizobium rhizogenes]
MKRKIIALTLSSAFTVVTAIPAFSQVVIYDDQYSEPDAANGQIESNFLHTWNRHHDAQNRRYDRRTSFGPNDVITLLEDRGYRVKNVKDVGERYLVQASRGGDDLLVSVSRDGDIMGVVHDRR